MKRGIGTTVLASGAGIGLSVLAALAWLAPGPAEATPTTREAKTGKAILAEQRRARGAYLARAANCMGCHTAQGGVPMPGGAVYPRHLARSSHPISRRTRPPESDSGTKTISGERCTRGSRVMVVPSIPRFRIPNTLGLHERMLMRFSLIFRRWRRSRKKIHPAV